MKNKLQHQKFKLTPVKLVSIILVSSLMAWVVYSVSAATSSISLITNKSSIIQGDSFSVTISVNTDTPAVFSTAKVKYNSAQITFQEVDYSSSAYPSEGPDTKINDGAVTISRYIIPDQGAFPSGRFILAKLNFQAKSGFSGTSSITVEQNGSEVFGSNGVNILSSVSGVNITVAKPNIPTVPTTPTNPSPQPPVSNPAGPTHTVTSPPSTPSTPAAPSTSRPTTPTTPTPSAPPSSNPITNYFRPATNPTSTQFKAGDSKLSKQPSLMQKILIWVKLLAPIVVVGTIIVGIVWFVIKKASMHAFGFGEAVTGLPHVGPVKTPISNTPANNPINQPVGPIKPSPSSGTNVKPSSYTDPNDNTPRTFSGV